MSTEHTNQFEVYANKRDQHVAEAAIQYAKTLEAAAEKRRLADALFDAYTRAFTAKYVAWEMRLTPAWDYLSEQDRVAWETFMTAEKARREKERGAGKSGPSAEKAVTPEEQAARVEKMAAHMADLGVGRVLTAEDAERLAAGELSRTNAAAAYGPAVRKVVNGVKIMMRYGKLTQVAEAMKHGDFVMLPSELDASLVCAALERLGVKVAVIKSTDSGRKTKYEVIHNGPQR